MDVDRSEGFPRTGDFVPACVGSGRQAGFESCSRGVCAFWCLRKSSIWLKRDYTFCLCLSLSLYIYIYIYIYVYTNIHFLRKVSFRVSQMALFWKYLQKRTRRANIAENESASRTQRTQGWNIPCGDTPHSDIYMWKNIESNLATQHIYMCCIPHIFEHVMYIQPLT